VVNDVMTADFVVSSRWLYDPQIKHSE